MSARRCEVDQFERVLDLLGQARDAVEAAEQVEPELAAQFGERGDDEVLAHGQAAEQLVDLVALGQAELADVGDVHAGDVAALEDDLAGGRRDLAGQHLEEGGLAGAVGADDAAQLAVVDGEVDVAVGDQAAIALGQAGRLQDRAGIVVALRDAAPASAPAQASRPRLRRSCCSARRQPDGASVGRPCALAGDEGA